MADHWHWTHDDTGLDDADFPPLDFGMDDEDTTCSFCGEEALDQVQGRLCEASCTGAILAREAATEDDHA